MLKSCCGRALCAVTLGLMASALVAAQQSAAIPKVVHVLGLSDVKQDLRGRLSVQSASLRFETGAVKADIPVSELQDVLTGSDSERVVGGTVGTLSMLA